MQFMHELPYCVLRDLPLRYALYKFTSYLLYLLTYYSWSKRTRRSVTRAEEKSGGPGRMAIIGWTVVQALC